MMTIDLWGWIKTAISFLTPSPAAVKGATMQDTIVSILMAHSKNFGPSPRTGGIIHTITLVTATLEAALIIQYSKRSNLDPLLVLAGIIGESAGDPYAMNPNNQDAKPGETPAEAALHMDVGVAQFDMRGLVVDPEMAGLTISQIQAKAMDLHWAIPRYCKYIVGLVAATAKEVAANPSILNFVPEHDQSLLMEEAYNVGVHGAEQMALKQGQTFAYAAAWEDRYKSYKVIAGQA